MSFGESLSSARSTIPSYIAFVREISSGRSFLALRMAITRSLQKISLSSSTRAIFATFGTISLSAKIAVTVKIASRKAFNKYSWVLKNGNMMRAGPS